MCYTSNLGGPKAHNTIHVNRDSQTVIIALQDDSPSHAFFGLLIWDAHLAADLFTCISSLHIGRDGNSVAHNLARHT